MNVCATWFFIGVAVSCIGFAAWMYWAMGGRWKWLKK